MKTYFLRIVTFFIAALFFILSAENVNAQNVDYQNVNYMNQPGDITFGAGISSGSGVGFLDNQEYGITAQFYYVVTEKIRAGADFTYYFIGERQLTANELNFNGHYFIRNRDGISLYGLGGINISNTSGDAEKWDDDPDTRKLGLNLGAGLELEIGNVSVFGEPKYTVLGWNQFLLTGGVRYSL